MPVSRLGWDVYDSYSHPRLVSFPWITGKVRAGDHYVVLDYIARRWNAEVEKIDKAASWGFTPRPVRGTTDIPSEHAAGVALDFNADEHPLNVPASKTLSAAQIKSIRQIMRDVRGAARWGGEWSRPDAMHVELMGGNALVGEVAERIRAGKLPTGGKGDEVKPAGAIKPKPPTPKPAGKSIERMADEVIAGKHGTGHEARRRSLGVSAATYEKVRAEVNRRAGGKAPATGKSISQMAAEVIAGKHGNGHPARQKSLGVNAATYAKVRAEVNKRA